MLFRHLSAKRTLALDHSPSLSHALAHSHSPSLARSLSLSLSLSLAHSSSLSMSMYRQHNEAYCVCLECFALSLARSLSASLSLSLILSRSLCQSIANTTKLIVFASSVSLLKSSITPVTSHLSLTYSPTSLARSFFCKLMQTPPPKYSNLVDSTRLIQYW